MSQNLTQPEEIDHVLIEIASHDREIDAPNPDGEPLNGATHNFECDWQTGQTNNE
ncbi:MAG: hypothetical protein Q7S46_06645 [Gallionella sp.]|nr:hypothetical protein [Gallionella sp.]